MGGWQDNELRLDKIVAYFKELQQHLPVGTEKKQRT
jgi:hypothetical protein